MNKEKILHNLKYCRWEPIHSTRLDCDFKNPFNIDFSVNLTSEKPIKV